MLQRINLVFFSVDEWNWQILKLRLEQLSWQIPVSKLIVCMGLLLQKCTLLVRVLDKLFNYDIYYVHFKWSFIQQFSINV